MTLKLAAWNHQVQYEKIFHFQKEQGRFLGWTHRIPLLPFQIMVVPSALLLIAVEEGKFSCNQLGTCNQLLENNFNYTYFKEKQAKRMVSIANWIIVETQFSEGDS